MDLFSLNNGDRFVWRGDIYTLINIDDDGNATVKRGNSTEESSFNPYAKIELIEDDTTPPTAPFWRCEECGHEDRTKPMPADRDKFYAKDEPARKCSKCKSMSLMPVGF